MPLFVRKAYFCLRLSIIIPMQKAVIVPFLVLVLLFSCLAIPLQSQDLTVIADQLRKHVSILASDSLEGRGLGTDGKILAKQYIAEQFRSAGLEPYGDDYFQHFDLRIGLARVPASNVIGYLPGSDPELGDEYIVIGAHYDHLGYEYRGNDRVIFPGADDNASGTAVLIELARYFSGQRDNLGRSIIFIAFDAEESGLLGAERFISDNKIVDNENIKLMFSLDMVGMYRANEGLELIGMGTFENGVDLAREVASRTGLEVSKLTADVAPRTDTWPFGEAGIPAVHVFTGTRSPYHKPEDTWDLLDYEGMALITSYMTELVLNTSITNILHPTRRFERLLRPYGLRISPGIITNIGRSNHVYPDEFFNASGVFAFSTGFFLKFQFGRKFSLQPELLYDYNGSQSPAGTYRRHSVTVPLNLHLYIAGDSGGFVKAYPIMGGYYRYHLAGKDGGTSLNFDNQHPSGEWGINLGFGLEILRVQVAYTLRRGLTDLTANPGSGSFANVSYFTMGYKF